jgi:hypothetical protein
MTQSPKAMAKRQPIVPAKAPAASADRKFLRFFSNNNNLYPFQTIVTKNAIKGINPTTPTADKISR